MDSGAFRVSRASESNARNPNAIKNHGATRMGKIPRWEISADNRRHFFLANVLLDFLWMLVTLGRRICSS